LKTNLPSLLAQYQQRTGQRLSYRALARATELNEYTVRGFANSTLREYPADALVKICSFFEVGIAELLYIDTVPDAPSTETE